MRLIDADALYEKVTKEIGFPGWNIIPHAIDDAPTIDAVPVVRCKDCKEYGENPYGEKGDMFCKCWGDWIPTDPDDFCSHGEMKEDD